MKKIFLVLGILAGLAFLGGAGFVGFLAARMGPRNAWGMLRYDTRREGDLKVGDQAADVSLVALDGTTRVRLAERLGGRPVVLTFGSFT